MIHALARGAAGIVVVLSVAGCTVEPVPTARETGPSSPAASATAAATPSESPIPSASTPDPTAVPSPTPEPPLSLDPPVETDPRLVSVAVSPEVPPDGGGRILVTVTSQADTRIDELVLRWPQGLGEMLLLAPFAPSTGRIVDGGPPLVQDWTKWVTGPGEQGEPAGTVSLGWGPLFPGDTLEIEILVTRAAPGPVEFDLQVLAGNALLTGPDGDGLELRIGID